MSWIRRKDYHLLTVGLTTYSSDERFSATHLKNSEVCLVRLQLSLDVSVGGRKQNNKLLSIFLSFPLFQDWTLQIKYVQMRDGGSYECQVTKHPPISIFLTLNVVGKHRNAEKKQFGAVRDIWGKALKRIRLKALKKC